MLRWPRLLLDRLDRMPLPWAALGVALAGAVVRALYFGVPRLTGSDCDGAAYLELARSLHAGGGYVTNALYHLWNSPAAFPRAESLWNPLYPFAIATVNVWVHDLWTAGKLVSLGFGLLVPPLTLLAALTFTGRRAVAVLAGMLAAFEPTLVTWSARPLTEIGTIALVTLAWVLAFRRERGAGFALGLAAGLAYLQKYQSGLIWVALVPAVFWDRGRRDGLRMLLAAAAGCVVVLAPWWIRNLSVFGDPFYSDIRWNLLCDWPSFGGEDRFWTRFVRPPDLWPYAFAHPMEGLRQANAGVHIITRLGWREHVASAWSAGLALVGLASVRQRPKRWLPFALYVAALLCFSAITIPRPRFLLSAMPALLTLAAAGAVALLEWRRVPRGEPDRARAGAVWVGWVAVLLVALVLGDDARATWRAATNTTTSWNAQYYLCALELKAGAEFLKTQPADGSPVIVTETSHAALYMERPALRMPFGEAGVDSLRRHFGAGWLVTTERDQDLRLPGWATAPPAWAQRVYHARPEEYAPDAVAAGYRFASPVVVYRLAVVARNRPSD